MSSYFSFSKQFGSMIPTSQSSCSSLLYVTSSKATRHLSSFKRFSYLCASIYYRANVDCRKSKFCFRIWGKNIISLAVLLKGFPRDVSNLTLLAFKFSFFINTLLTLRDLGPSKEERLKLLLVCYCSK